MLGTHTEGLLSGGGGGRDTKGEVGRDGTKDYNRKKDREMKIRDKQTVKKQQREQKKSPT